MVSRRDLVRAAGGAAVAGLAAPVIIPSSALGADGAVAPSNRIATAIIGCGGMNGSHHSTLLGTKEAQVVAVCDPQPARREAARQKTEGAYARASRDGAFAGCRPFNDYRELLARPDVDAVFIATPDHWHAPIAIAACAAGKDVYVEKPMTDCIAAGQALVRAVRRYNRVLQVGQQQRSDAKFRQACELVRNGRIGRLKHILVEVPGGRDSGKVPPPQPVPEGLDWDLWLGPAPWRPYSKERITNAYWWHCYDYGIGFQAGWGIHHVDIAQWGSGHDGSGPVEVAPSMATFPADGICDTPVKWVTEFAYGDGVKMTFTGQGNLVTFEGTEGTVRVTRGMIDAEPKSLLQARLGPGQTHLYRSDHHIQNFLDCCRSRRDPIAPVEVGHKSNVICCLSDIAIRLGRRLKWDPASETFPDDPTAARMLARELRAPYRL